MNANRGTSWIRTVAAISVMLLLGLGVAASAEAASLDAEFKRPDQADVSAQQWKLRKSRRGEVSGGLLITVTGVEEGKQYILKGEIIDVATGESTKLETPPLKAVPGGERKKARQRRSK